MSICEGTASAEEVDPYGHGFALSLVGIKQHFQLNWAILFLKNYRLVKKLI